MNRLCFLCCTKITKFPSSNAHRTGQVSNCCISQITVAWPTMCTSNTANQHTRKGRGDGSWNRTMEVWNGKVVKIRTINSTSKLHTVVRHVNTCAVYDTRYTWSLSGYLWIESPKVTSKNLMYGGTGMVVTLQVSLLHGLTLLGNQLSDGAAS
jgi:hypothetical protein